MYITLPWKNSKYIEMARVHNIKHTRTQHTNRGIVLSLSNIYIKKEKQTFYGLWHHIDFCATIVNTLSMIHIPKEFFTVKGHWICYICMQ